MLGLLKAKAVAFFAHSRQDLLADLLQYGTSGSVSAGHIMNYNFRLNSIEMARRGSPHKIPELYNDG